jgi:hypothetical protein
MDMSALSKALDQQDHVLSRAQVLENGGSDNDIARMLRRREWAQVHPGVYVDHTGPLTREQHEWAAVLYCSPSALTGRSALEKYGLWSGREVDKRDQRPVEIAIGRNRRVGDRPGIEIVRLQRFDQDVHTNLAPPRVRLEQAVLGVASASPDVSSAVAVICDAVQSRRTTAPRLLAALEARPRLRHRALLGRILTDVTAGAYSVLEREYLLRVERPHGLPTGSRQRQVRIGRSNTYRDVEYLRHATIVELDGRLGHELARDRWDDMERDIGALTAGSLTARLGWAPVLEPCRAASAVAAILAARGWAGTIRPCSPTCLVGSICGAEHAPGACHAPQND